MKPRSKILRAVLFALGATVCTTFATTTAKSQALPVGDETDDAWRYSITPYAYVPFSIEGTSVVGGTGVDLDLGFSDAIDLMDFAISGRAEFLRGDWGIIAHLYYVDAGLEGDADLPGGGTENLGVDVTQRWVASLGSYRFATGTYGISNRRFAWNAGAGVRWNSIKQEIEEDLDVGVAPRVQTTVGGTETWWEPTIMLRGVYEVGNDWTLGGRVELGGFGTSDDSLQYSVLFRADWQGWEKTSLSVG